MTISSKFKEKWNFQRAIGSIDGKNIRSECPKNTGFFSLVLLLVCDANYSFIMFDVVGMGVIMTVVF